MAFKNPITQVTRLSQLIADSITGATITGGKITGALIRTAVSGERIEVSADNFIRLFSGRANETVPATIQAHDSGTYPTLAIISGNDGSGSSSLNLSPGQASLNSNGDVDLNPNAVDGTVRAVKALQIGPYVGAGLSRHQVGRAITGVDFGNESYAFDGLSGQAHISHGLATTPVYANVNVTPNNRDVRLVQIGAGDITVQLIDSSGAAVLGESHFVRWLVMDG